MGLLLGGVVPEVQAQSSVPASAGGNGTGPASDNAQTRAQANEKQPNAGPAKEKSCSGYLKALTAVDEAGKESTALQTSLDALIRQTGTPVCRSWLQEAAFNVAFARSGLGGELTSRAGGAAGGAPGSGQAARGTLSASTDFVLHFLTRAGVKTQVSDKISDTSLPSVPRASSELRRAAENYLHRALQQSSPVAGIKEAIRQQQELLLLSVAAPEAVESRRVELGARAWTYALWLAVQARGFEPKPSVEQQLAAQGGVRYALSLLASVDGLDEAAWISLVSLAQLSIWYSDTLDETEWKQSLPGEPTGPDLGRFREYRSWFRWSRMLSSTPEPESQQLAATLLSRILVWQTQQSDGLSASAFGHPREEFPRELELRRLVSVAGTSLFDELDALTARIRQLGPAVLERHVQNELPAQSLGLYGMRLEYSAVWATTQAHFMLLPDERSKPTPPPAPPPATDATSTGNTVAPQTPSLTASEEAALLRDWQPLEEALKYALIGLEHSRRWARTAEELRVRPAPDPQASPFGAMPATTPFAAYSSEDVLDEVLTSVELKLESTPSLELNQKLAQRLMPLLLRIQLPLPVLHNLLLQMARNHPDTRLKLQGLTLVQREARIRLETLQADAPTFLGDFRRYLEATDALLSMRITTNNALLVAALTEDDAWLSAQVIQPVARLELLPYLKQSTTRIGGAACIDIDLIHTYLDPGRRSLPQADGSLLVTTFTAAHKFLEDRKVAEAQKGGDAEELPEWPCGEPVEMLPLAQPAHCVYLGTDAKKEKTVCQSPPLWAQVRGLSRWLELLTTLTFEDSNSSGRLGIAYPILLATRSLSVALNETQQLRGEDTVLRESLETAARMAACASQQVGGLVLEKALMASTPDVFSALPAPICTRPVKPAAYQPFVLFLEHPALELPPVVTVRIGVQALKQTQPPLTGSAPMLSLDNGGSSVPVLTSQLRQAQRQQLLTVSRWLTTELALLREQQLDGLERPWWTQSSLPPPPVEPASIETLVADTPDTAPRQLTFPLLVPQQSGGLELRVGKGTCPLGEKLLQQGSVALNPLGTCAENALPLTLRRP